MHDVKYARNIGRRAACALQIGTLQTIDRHSNPLRMPI